MKMSLHAIKSWIFRLRVMQLEPVGCGLIGMHFNKILDELIENMMHLSAFAS